MDAHIVTPKMGRKGKFVVNKAADSEKADPPSRKSNIAVDESSLSEEDVNNWTSERIMRWVIIFLSVLVLLLTVITVILVAQQSSEPKDGTLCASQGEIPSLTTRPPLVQQIERDEDDVQTTTPAQDVPRKGRLPPGFWPQEHTTHHPRNHDLVTEEAGRMEPVSTTADSVSLEASGELPVNAMDASGDASGSGDAGIDETKSSSPQMPHMEELLPVSNSHSTLDTWSRFLTFQDSGRTTRQAPPLVQASDHHDYSDYSEVGANGASEGVRVCHSAACRRLSSLMGGIMNEETSPCQDFYRLACGGLSVSRSFVRLTPIGPHEDVDRRLSLALSQDANVDRRKLLTTLDDQCRHLATAMNEQKRLEVVRKVVGLFGHFLTPADAIPVDVTSLLIQLLLAHNTPVFDVLLDIGRPDGNRFVFKITPPHHPPLLGHVRSDKDHCLPLLQQPDDAVEAFESYSECMREHWVTMDRLKMAVQAMDFGWQDNDLDELYRFIDMDYFEVLKSHLPAEGSLRKMLVTKDYTDMSLDQLDRLCPAVKWRRLLSALIGRHVAQHERIHVYAPVYLKGICRDFLASRDVRQVYNTLLALYVDDLYQNFVPDESLQRRHCQSVAVHLMEDVASSAYLSTFTDSELKSMKNRLNDVFIQLKTTLVEIMQTIDSVDHATRSDLLSKAQTIRIDLDNGMFLRRHPQTLDDRWKDFELGTEFITSAIALVNRYRRKMYELYWMNPDDPEAVWSFCALPTFTTGYVLYSLNKLVIPFGTVAGGQLENADYPDFWNLGRIGYLMAHELMHAFDLSGIDHQMATDLNETEAYRRGMKCLDDGLQPEFRSLVDVQRVANELYADATGLTLAFETYKRIGRRLTLPVMNWTDEQLFFVAAAQIYCSDSPASLLELATKEHLPGPLRVNHLMNLNSEFVRVFQCPPEQICKVFPLH